MNGLRFELGLKLGGDLLRQAAVAVAQDMQPRHERFVGRGVQPAEGQLLQLVADFLDAHAAGERRIDVHRLLGDEAPLLGLHVLKRAHVVQPVGELDEQHAHIARYGDQELPEILGLLRLLGGKIELLDLGQAVDQRGDVRAEELLDLFQRGGRVLDGVVKQRRRRWSRRRA